VRTGCGAATTEVSTESKEGFEGSELLGLGNSLGVNMEAMLARCEAFNFNSNRNRRVGTTLSEGNIWRKEESSCFRSQI
jgi:hypothetical protein